MHEIRVCGTIGLRARGKSRSRPANAKRAGSTVDRANDSFAVANREICAKVRHKRVRCYLGAEKAGVRFGARLNGTFR
jgi:hypothetical protein